MAKEAAAKETKKSTSTGNTALDAVMSQIRKEFGEMITASMSFACS